MPYTKTTFNNGGPPAISAEELNKLGQGIMDVESLLNLKTNNLLAINDGYMNKLLSSTSSPITAPSGSYVTYFTNNYTRTKGYEKLSIDTGGYAYSSPGGTARPATFRIYANDVQKYEGSGTALIDLSPYAIGSTVTVRIDVLQVDWSSWYCNITIKTHDVFPVI